MMTSAHNQTAADQLGRIGIEIKPRRRIGLKRSQPTGTKGYFVMEMDDKQLFDDKDYGNHQGDGYGFFAKEQEEDLEKSSDSDNELISSLYSSSASSSDIEFESDQPE